jgi:Hemerythrin HHE cation binding domain
MVHSQSQSLSSPTFVKANPSTNVCTIHPLYPPTNPHLDLTMHHTIEERQLFPLLAKRMPAFSTLHDQDHGQHIESHRAIHKGLDELSALISKYKADQTSYNPDEMRACLDGFREVLFRHLDEEVSCVVLNVEGQINMDKGRGSECREYEEVLVIGGIRAIVKSDAYLRDQCISSSGNVSSSHGHKEPHLDPKLPSAMSRMIDARLFSPP